MSFRRIAVIFDDRARPETTGVYCRRALGRLAEVEHVLPEDLSRVPPGRFDLFCHVDDGLGYRLPPALRPSVWWAIDTHLDFEAALDKARSFDHVFAAQRDGADRLRASGVATAEWLPLACDPDLHARQPAAKEFDLCFVGNVFPGPRADLLEVLRRHFPSLFVGRRYFEEMARVYSASRLAFNRSIRNDVNMRVFEAAACGSLLLTNDLRENGQEELLRDGAHLAAYRDADELVDKARFYLKNEGPRERIAAAGRTEVLARHTYRHRMETLIRSVGRRVATAPAVATVEAPVGGEAQTTRGGRDAGYYRFARPEVLALVPRGAEAVLDVGCGCGRLGQALKARQPARVYGVEWDPDAAREAAAVLDGVVVGDAEAADLGLRPASLDAVVCADILEHLRDPARLMRRLRELLRPGGVLIASIPNVQHHSVVRGLLRGDWSYEPAGLLDRDHLRFFTRREVEKLLSRAGYGLRALHRIPGPGDAEMWAGLGPEEVKVGALTVNCADAEEADDFFTYQFLIEAEPLPPHDDGLTSIVVVTLGQLEYTRCCVESIMEKTDEAFELIFIDNGSADGTPDYLASVPNSRLVRNEANRGFPAAVNQGLRLARGRQVVLLNNDTVVTTGWLRRLLDALHEDDRVGLVGPSSNNVSGGQQVEVAYDGPDGLDGFAWEWGKRNHGRRQDTDRLVGFCLLARKDAVDRIGEFDERFGVGCFEDDDYCLRALQTGYRVVHAVDAFVHHVGGQTFGACGVDFAELMRRNETLFKDKWRHLPGRGEAAGPTEAAPRDRRFGLAPAPGGMGLRLTRGGAGLSLCMIVRDNAGTIRQALESVRPWVDEMVVVDTGSVDDTPRIAESLGARVFHFKWVDDFSAARNESVRHARSGWVFWMDSDDVIDAANGAGLRGLVGRPVPDDVLGFVVSVRCPSADPADPYGYTRVTHVKLFRNLPHLRFEHRIHEQILPAILRAGGRVEFTDLFVEHAGYDTSPEGQQRKLERDLRLLHGELSERPGHPFTLFNLGMTYADVGRHEEAVGYLEQCLKNSPEKASHVRKARALLCHCHQSRGDLAAAWDACLRGLKAFPLDAELRFRKGMLEQQRGDLDAAAASYRDVLERPEGDHFTSVNSGLAGHLTQHNLALVYLAQQKWGEAEALLRRVTEEQPRYRPGWVLLGEALARQGKHGEARSVGSRAAADPGLGSTGRVLLGHVGVEEGSLAAARREFETAVAEHPGDLHALHALARFLFERVGLEAAEPALTALARLDPKDPAVRHNLGLVYLQTKRAPLAVEQFREALRLRPAEPDTRSHLRDALLACGLVEQAQAIPAGLGGRADPPGAT